jgi:hypothetical protein
MNLDNRSPVSPNPLLRRRLYFVGLSPLLGVVVATFVVRIPVLTTLAALAGAFVPMVAARSFVISLLTSQDRPRLRGTFGMMYDRLPPGRLQRWYVPLIGGAIGAALAELVRAVFFLWRAGAPLAVRLVVAPTAIGSLEGAFLILTAIASWGLASSLLLGRWRPDRAA